jgi:hypothetical protein
MAQALQKAFTFGALLQVFRNTASVCFRKIILDIEGEQFF